VSMSTLPRHLAAMSSAHTLSRRSPVGCGRARLRRDR
jgi:hypothetical protein